MFEPLVSIIIPVYNGSNYLKESIDSALAQTYLNIEVIVINDGSQDKGATESIALEYGDKIRYFSKENGGVSSALNLGIKKMRGDWFSWLSHDDLYSPDKILEQIKLINKNMNANCIVFSKSGLIDSDGNKIKHYINRFYLNRYSGNKMFRILMKGINLNGCTLLIPKDVFNNYGYFDTELKYIQDWYMWVTLALNDLTFIKCNKRLVQMRVHDNQQTQKIKGLRPNELKIVGNRLIKLLSDKNNNQYKVRALLYWSIKNQLKDISNNCFDGLKKSGKLRLIDYMKINFNKLFIKTTLYPTKFIRATLNYLRRN